MHIQENGEYIALFNPEIVSTGELQYIAMEGCLSFPGIILDIGRAREVTVKYHDQLQREHTKTFKDIDAKCILHEIEHLDGKTFKDHVSDLKYNMALKRAKKNDYAN